MMHYTLFFFNDTATTEIYTLSLHDALPIWCGHVRRRPRPAGTGGRGDRGGLPHAHAPGGVARAGPPDRLRSEEHTSELQSQSNIVCRLLLDKKEKYIY